MWRKNIEILLAEMQIAQPLKIVWEISQTPQCRILRERKLQVKDRSHFYLAVNKLMSAYKI